MVPPHRRAKSNTKSAVISVLVFITSTAVNYVGLLCVGNNADVAVSKHSALGNILTAEK
jgi:predicted transcriptional regulator YheO